MHNKFEVNNFMKKLKTLYFEDFVDFACEASDMYDSIKDDFKAVAIVAKYEEAKEILKELICIGYDIAHIELCDELFDDYHDEYLIALTNKGIYCEKFKRENGYIRNDSVVTYVSNECSSTCLKHIDSDVVIAFEIGDEEYELTEDLEVGISDDECDCCNCESCCDCDEDMHGFTASKNNENGYSSISFYSTEKIDADEMKDLLEIFGL